MRSYTGNSKTKCLCFQFQILGILNCGKKRMHRKTGCGNRPLSCEADPTQYARCPFLDLSGDLEVVQRKEISHMI